MTLPTRKYIVFIYILIWGIKLGPFNHFVPFGCNFIFIGLLFILLLLGYNVIIFCIFFPRTLVVGNREGNGAMFRTIEFFFFYFSTKQFILG